MSSTTSPPVTVNVTIDLPTLLGLAKIRTVSGYGAIPASVARVASDATWKRFITDPQTEIFWITAVKI